MQRALCPEGSCSGTDQLPEAPWTQPDRSPPLSARSGQQAALHEHLPNIEHKEHRKIKLTKTSPPRSRFSRFSASLGKLLEEFGLSEERHGWRSEQLCSELAPPSYGCTVTFVTLCHSTYRFTHTHTSTHIIHAHHTHLSVHTPVSQVKVDWNSVSQ